MKNMVNTITLTFTGDFVTFNDKVRKDMHLIKAHRYGHNTSLTYDWDTELATYIVYCDDMEDAKAVMEVVAKYC